MKIVFRNGKIARRVINRVVAKMVDPIAREDRAARPSDTPNLTLVMCDVVIEMQSVSAPMAPLCVLKPLRPFSTH
jgi:hypothetical protein